MVNMYNFENLTRFLKEKIFDFVNKLWYNMIKTMKISCKCYQFHVYNNLKLRITALLCMIINDVTIIIKQVFKYILFVF